MNQAWLVVEASAVRGEQWAIQRVAHLARGDANSNTWAVARAKAVLTEVDRVSPDALNAFLTGEAQSQL